MTPAERALWLSVQRRAASYQADIAREILRAFQMIAEQMSEAEITRALQFGRIDLLFAEAQERAARELAYQGIREQLRRGVMDGVKYYAREITIPASARTLVIAFDVLNPKMIEAIRTLETRVITSLDAGIRATVQAAAERGLVAGVNPRTVAREIRTVIGLGPTQLQEVENFRDALLGQNGRTLEDYSRRNRRYDGLVKSGRITPAQVEKAVEAYRKSRTALNAETTARTAALDAQKLAQRLSFEDAIAKGIIDRDRVTKTWVGVLDDRERDEHRQMEGVRVGFDEPFVLPDGTEQQIPGDTEYNCRCIARYTVR